MANPCRYCSVLPTVCRVKLPCILKLHYITQYKKCVLARSAYDHMIISTQHICTILPVIVIVLLGFVIGYVQCTSYIIIIYLHNSLFRMSMFRTAMFMISIATCYCKSVSRRIPAHQPIAHPSPLPSEPPHRTSPTFQGEWEGEGYSFRRITLLQHIPEKAKLRQC
jgi:hypothetical protein